MKDLLIILSILLLTSPLFGQETGVLYQYESSSGIQWKTFGNEKVQPKYEGEIKNGKMDGLGVLIYPYGGKSVVGEWKDGKEWNTKHTKKDGTLINLYENGKTSEIKQWTKQLGTSGWVQGSGTAGWDQGSGVTTDSSGNIYLTGTTDGGLDGNTNLGEMDIFLVKYNSSGTKQWTKQLGTTGRDYGYSVTTDSSGNIYVTGYTGGDLDGNTSSGSDDIFLVKYNSSGTKQWTKQLGTSKDDKGNGVTTDSSGNIYVTGITKGGLDGNTNSGDVDIFLVKYNSSGTKQWTKQLGTTGRDYANGVTTVSSGNIYVTGCTDERIEYNPWTSGNSAIAGLYELKHADGKVYLDGLTNLNTKSYVSRSGGVDIFLVKYNSTGKKQWTKQMGTTEYDCGSGITTDLSDNIYVTGYTYGGLDGNANSEKIRSSWFSTIFPDGYFSYGSDIFLIKFNSFGTKQWTKQLGTTGSDYATDVTTDSSGNIYLTGTTEGGLDGNTNSGDVDIFLVKYNSSGTKQWTNQLGTYLDEKANGITTDSSGNIYVTGYTYGGLDGNSNLKEFPGSGRDIFLIKYNSSGIKQ